MLSNILDRISFWSLFVVATLLPIFFLPFTKIPVETSKILLLVVGLTVSVVFWSAARFSDGKISMPKSWILFSGLILVLGVFISTLFSSTFNVSFFGIMVDNNSFLFLALSVLLMVMFSIYMKSVKDSRILLIGILSSFVLLFLFQIIRFMAPNTFSLGILGGKTDSLLGSWNSVGILSGLFTFLSLFVLEFFELPKKIRLFFLFLGVLSLFFVIVVNFVLVWELLGIFSLVIFVYKISIFSVKNTNTEGSKVPFPAFAFAVLMISLLFFMSGKFVGSFIPSKMGLENVEIRPTLSTTLSVGKSAIMHDPIFGIGPNRFSEIWGSYKPAIINTTQFWNAPFVFGSGFIPTNLVTTGILGIATWLFFLGCLAVFGIKNLFIGIKKGYHSEAILFFLGGMYLFIAGFFYNIGVVPILFAFMFTGIFVGLSSRNNEKELSVSFLSNPRKSFFYILALIILMLVASGASFRFLERFASVYYYTNALSSSTLDNAENNINRALSFYSNDLYLRTASDIYFAKIGELLNKKTPLTDEDKTILQNSFDKARSAGILAISYNPNNYVNFAQLGNLYSSSAVLGVDGALDQALDNFKKASDLNPNNPGFKLNISQIYFSLENYKDAEIYANEALTLKSDYIDAYLILSQIAKKQGNNIKAIDYAGKALDLAPANQQLIDYLSSLKNNHSSTNETSTDSKKVQ